LCSEEEEGGKCREEDGINDRDSIANCHNDNKQHQPRTSQSGHGVVKMAGFDVDRCRFHTDSFRQAVADEQGD
jgi:hypothetical protein